MTDSEVYVDPTPAEYERALACILRFKKMVSKQDWHWGYLGEEWADDGAVLDDLDLATRALAEAKTRREAADDVG